MKLRWSVTIPTYNSAEYLEETLLSVLNQGLGEDEIEILVIDNCSTDGTADLVRRVGKGRVRFFQNESNIGINGNFNRCVKMAKGELVHLLNSDDTVNPGFYQEYEKQFSKHPKVYFMSCDAAIINEKSEVIGKSETVTALLTPTNRINELIFKNDFRTPSVVIRKKAYEVLGGFDKDLVFTADWDMWLRVIYNYQGLHLNKTLCNYRVHSSNETTGFFLSGNDTLDFERLFKKFEALGYPIERPAYLGFLRVMSTEHFASVYRQRPRNAQAVQALGRIHRRFSSTREHLKLVVALELSMTKSKVTKALLGR